MGEKLTGGIEPLARPGRSRAEELAERIEASLLERIGTNEERLGSKDELRQRYQVSHGTLNEAVRVLETRGLIELRRGPQGGVFAAPPSLNIRLSQLVLGLKRSSVDVGQCLAVRNQLEPMILREAARVVRTQPEAIAPLNELADRMEATIGNPAESLKWNWLLHRRIAEMGGNAILTGIYVALLDFIEQAVDEVIPTKTYARASRIVAMHRDLIAAIALGDPERAAEAAKSHPLPVEDDVEGVIDGR